MKVRGGILAVRQDSLGDVLLAGPAIRALARSGPVTLLCGERGAAAAELLPGVAEAIVWTAPWIDPEPAPLRRRECAELIAAVARREPREAVIFTSFHQSPLPAALLLRLAGVPRIAAISSDYPGSLLDVRHPVAEDLHEVDRALSLAEAAGHSLPAGDDASLRVKPAEPRLPGLPEQPFLLLHPGASVSARAWEPEQWALLASELSQRGHRVVVTGAPEEIALTGFVAAAAPGALDLGGSLDLGELGAVLARAAAVAVANTGPAHLAAAVGTPVASLFAPTVPAVRWRPWGVPHRLLYREVECAGCRARSCPVPGHPCLSGVEPVEVAEALERLATRLDGTPEGAVA